MRWMSMIGLLAATGALAQEGVPSHSSSSTERQEQAPAAAPEQAATITVPAGTRIPVKLTYSVWSKTAHVGDAVHAVTVFPVTVDTTVAIPEGTYVEGVIDKVVKRTSANHPALQMHFTKLLFANGYAVPLQEATAEARAGKDSGTVATASAPGEGAPGVNSSGNSGVVGNSFGAQQPPVVTPPPMPGPSVGEVVGIGVGVTAASVIAMVLLGRHRSGYTMLDAGSQLEMVLQDPLTLDAAQVAAAMATPSAE
jgi:hypothetical protein